MSSRSSLHGRYRRRGVRSGVVVVAVVAVIYLVLGAFGAPRAVAASRGGVIKAVGAENEYANVLAQIGGRYVSVTSILNNPNTDPHTFEASPSVAERVAAAQLIVQNGVGYDSFMNNVEQASPNPTRKVIVAQDVLGLPTTTPNPHLWYDPTTMPAVAAVMAKDLTALDPTHRAYFHLRLQHFDASLGPWLQAIALFKRDHRGEPVAVTEPVADYLLQAMGMKILTPFVFQADIMNGVDPSPEGIAAETTLLRSHEVKVFCYNEQVVDALTNSIRHNATTAKVPVVAVYETMPTPGFTYQSWMMAEVTALEAAVLHHRSTASL